MSSYRKIVCAFKIDAASKAEVHIVEGYDYHYYYLLDNNIKQGRSDTINEAINKACADLNYTDMTLNFTFQIEPLHYECEPFCLEVRECRTYNDAVNRLKTFNEYKELGYDYNLTEATWY